MNQTLHGGESRKLISIARPAQESGIVETTKGTGGTARTLAGQDDCNSQECKRPIEPIAFPVYPIKLISERAGTTARTLAEIRFQHDEPHSHWGLNE